MKWKFGLTVAAGMVMSLLAGQARAAAPVCTAGTTNLGLSGSFVLGDVTGNHCVEAGDKIFGSFSTSGAFTGTGSGNLLASQGLQGNVTISFLGQMGASTTGTITYSVAIDPVLAGGFMIHDLQKDFTLNAADGATFATATLTGTAGGMNLSCTRTVFPNATNCPVTVDFPTLLLNATVTQTITTGANAVVGGLTDTISQAKAPEPASLGLLGAGLVGLGLVARRKRSV